MKRLRFEQGIANLDVVLALLVFAVGVIVGHLWT